MGAPRLFLASFLLFLHQDVLGQRSIQLGSTGPRPVQFGQQPNPAFTQQFSFPQFQQQQRQQQPQPQVQQLPSGFPPIGTFPIAHSNTGRQPTVPQTPATTAASAEEEYDDEYIEEPAPRQPVQQQQATLRPAPTRPPTRVRLTQAAPQRFAVSPQQNTQSRRPVARPTPVQEISSPVNTYQARPTLTLGQDTRLLNGDRQATTPLPVQTLDRYMRVNDDGSTSWGYTNEDGSFKEETIGKDCVVKGKYGYVDPDGVRREFEYQTGNPCDPNRPRGQPEEEEEDELVQVRRPQQIAGLLNARPQQQQQLRPAQRFQVQQQ